MDKFIQELIQPFLEEDNSFKNIALIPGGFKPPTLGHFYTTLEISKRDELDEVIVLIGHGVRDGIDKEKSLKVWEIYKKYLPSKVNIKISEKPSPVGDVNSIIKNNPNNFYFPVVGVRGEQDLEDIKRFDSLKGKYDTINVKDKASHHSTLDTPNTKQQTPNNTQQTTNNKQQTTHTKHQRRRRNSSSTR